MVLYTGKPKFQIRWILVILCQFIYFLKAMTTTSLSITILAMVNDTKTFNGSDDLQQVTEYKDSCPRALLLEEQNIDDGNVIKTKCFELYL